MSQLSFTTEKEYDGYLNVNSCGQQWLADRDYNTLRKNGRVDYSVYYIAKGQGYYTFNGKSHPLRADSVLLYFPGVRHHYFFRKEDGTEMLWSHFSGQACSLLDDLRADGPVVITVQDRKQFQGAFEKMIDAHYKHGYNSQLCNGYMLVLLALLQKSAATPPDPQQPCGNEQLEKVLSRMHMDFNKPIDIRQYAGMCHLSEDRFIRMFKAYTGLPPYRYQLKIRIERAVEMLENHSLSISECAGIVGFHDVAYFSRIFKKFTGHPPSYYK